MLLIYCKYYFSTILKFLRLSFSEEKNKWSHTRSSKRREWLIYVDNWKALKCLINFTMKANALYWLPWSESAELFGFNYTQNCFQLPTHMTLYMRWLIACNNPLRKRWKSFFFALVLLLQNWDYIWAHCSIDIEVEEVREVCNKNEVFKSITMENSLQI